MSKTNCYLLLDKEKLTATKDEILRYVRNGSDLPDECQVIMSAALAQAEHYDFVRYCYIFKIAKGLTSYAIVYAPSSYMSYLLIRFQNSLVFSASVDSPHFIDYGIAGLIYEYQKSAYSRPTSTQWERMRVWRKKIDQELGFA